MKRYLAKGRQRQSKGILKKTLALLTTCTLVSNLAITAFAKGEETLYQGYREQITVNGDQDRFGIRVKDGKEQDGKDRVAYCYDVKMSYPSKQDEQDYNGQDDKCYFSRIENYLESEDEYIIKYGVETKQKIAMALYVGYPCDAFGYRKLYPLMSNDEARQVTQTMLWDITADRSYPYDIYDPPKSWSGLMVKYHNTIYNNVIKDFHEGNMFHQGWLDVIGDFEFRSDKGYHQTGKIETSGEKGRITFSRLDPGLEIVNWDTEEVVTNEGLNVGDSFYVRSTAPLSETQKFEMTYSYDQVKFYFYKHEKGGQRVLGQSEPGKRIQNLIRVEPTDQSIVETIQIKLNGDKVPAPKKTSVTVEKTWVGPAADSVTIYLEADGARQETVTLNKEKGWRYTFENLDENRADGSKIEYIVKEEPVTGYQSEVTGNMKDGFVIKNTNAEKRQIPVKKVWEGGTEAEITVKLMADHQEKASAVLREDKGWEHTFEDVTKYDPTTGQEIQYTVQEDPVPAGYTAHISGDMAGGFIIKNSKPEPTPPGESDEPTPPDEPDGPTTPKPPQPEPPKPEAPTPEAPKPETPTPEAPTPEAPKPEAPTPEAPKPEAPTPEAPKPEVPKPEPIEPVPVPVPEPAAPASTESAPRMDPVPKTGITWEQQFWPIAFGISAAAYLTVVLHDRWKRRKNDKA